MDIIQEVPFKFIINYNYEIKLHIHRPTKVDLLIIMFIGHKHDQC